jgi:CheY-like chemotaxis protein
MSSQQPILVVDDDPGIRLLIETILRREGYSIITAEDGMKAKAMIERKRETFSSILLDWNMPEMTGIELLRWIKEQPELENTPVIMQTALDSPERIREGIDAGAYYYLVKPFDEMLLVSIVKGAVSDFGFKNSLLGRVKESENPFKLLTEGRFRFKTLADGEYLAVRIASACPVPEEALMISELITNAVEHGNLAITYDEKTKLVEDGALLSEVERRLALPEFASRNVELSLSKSPDKLIVTIEDQGKGFDYKKYLDFDETRVFDNHGRGIAMSRSALGLEYVGAGNKVIVTVPFKG